MNRNDSVPPVEPRAVAPRDPLQPDPRFAEFLEWQLASELRRATRFGRDGAPSAATPRLRLDRLLRAAAVLLGALALGACGAIAVQEAERHEEGQRLHAQYAVQIELARGREERAQKELDQRTQLQRAGALSEEERDESEARVASLRLERELLELDAVEVAASGRAPDRSLGAPLVAGRDFVGERLALELADAQRELARRVARRDRLDALQRMGQLPLAELERARADLAGAELRAHSAEQHGATRRAFLAGKCDALAAELAGLRAAAEAERANASNLLAVATAQRDRLALLHQRGRIPTAELSAAEQAVADAKARLELAELELAALAQRRG